MANTSNHGWEIPDVNGSKDVWGQILNDFFDDELDRQVKLEGLFADRPSAGSSSVKYYHATDRRIVYYNDGNTWEAVYGLGTDSNPVPGTSHFESISTAGRVAYGEAELITASASGISIGASATKTVTFSSLTGPLLGLVTVRSGSTGGFRQSVATFNISMVNDSNQSATKIAEDDSQDIINIESLQLNANDELTVTITESFGFDRSNIQITLSTNSIIEDAV